MSEQEIVTKNKEIISLLDQMLAEAKEGYEKEFSAIKEKEDRINQEYIAKKEALVTNVVQVIDSKDKNQVSSLGLEKKIAELMDQNRADLDSLDKEKYPIKVKYHKQKDEAFKFALSDIIPLIEQRYQKCSDFDSEISEKLEESEAYLDNYREINNRLDLKEFIKENRNKSKPNMILQEIMQKKDECEKIVEKYVRQRDLIKDITSNEIIMPIVIEAYNDVNSSKIRVLVPASTHSNGLARQKLEENISQILNKNSQSYEKFGTDWLIGWSIDSKSKSTKAEIEPFLKNGLDEHLSSVGISPQFYLHEKEVLAEPASAEAKTVQIETKDELIHIRDLAKLLGVCYNFIHFRYSGKSKYGKDPELEKIAIRVKENGKGQAKLFFKKAQAIEYFSRVRTRSAKKSLDEVAAQENTIENGENDDWVTKDELEAITKISKGIIYGLYKGCSRYQKNEKLAGMAKIAKKGEGHEKILFKKSEAVPYLRELLEQGKIRGEVGSRRISAPIEIKEIKDREDLINTALDYMEKHNEALSPRWTSHYKSEIQKYFPGIKKFVGTTSKSKEGKKLRKDIAMIYALDGMSSPEIGKKLGITGAQVIQDIKGTGVLLKDTIRRRFDSLDKIKNEEIEGIKAYKKDAQRGEMLLKIIDTLPNPDEISYFGLEGPHFGSYINFSELCRIIPEKSLVAENDEKNYYIMKSFIRHCNKIKDGKIFKGLNLFFGDIAAIPFYSPKYKDFKFDVINLDYTGYIGEKREKVIANLFENGKIADNSSMFITLCDDERRKEGIVGDMDQYKMLLEDLKSLGEKHNYEIMPSLEPNNYKSNKYIMMLTGFNLKKK